MGLSAATTDEEVSTSDHSQDTTVDRIEAETSSPAKDVLDHAKDGAKSVAQNKSCEFLLLFQRFVFMRKSVFIFVFCDAQEGLLHL